MLDEFTRMKLYFVSFFFLHIKSYYLLLGLDALAVVNAALFYQVNAKAGLLFAPYLLWLSFATYLNYSIWQLNKDEKTQVAAAPPAIAEEIKTE